MTQAALPADFSRAPCELKLRRGRKLPTPEALDERWKATLALVHDPALTRPQITEAKPDALVEALEASWTSFCDANPDDLTSPEDFPNHALMTCEQFVQFALAALDNDKESK